MVAPPHGGFVPSELCSWSSFISPQAFNFLISRGFSPEKTYSLGPSLVLAEGAGGGCHLVFRYLKEEIKFKITNENRKAPIWRRQSAVEIVLVLVIGREELWYDLEASACCEISCGLHPAFIYLCTFQNEAEGDRKHEYNTHTRDKKKVTYISSWKFCV